MGWRHSVRFWKQLKPLEFRRSGFCWMFPLPRGWIIIPERFLKPIWTIYRNLAVCAAGDVMTILPSCTRNSSFRVLGRRLGLIACLPGWRNWGWLRKSPRRSLFLFRFLISRCGQSIYGWQPCCGVTGLALKFIRNPKNWGSS